MMDSYVFYFDESFHDRKIRIKTDGTMNTLRNDALDNYIGVFWGSPTEEIRSNRETIQRFENKYRKFYGLQPNQELKSTLISKKNFVYGIRSFNDETMDFYEDFFRMLDFLNPLIHVDMISKMELFLRNAFEGLDMNNPYIEMIPNAFFYSLTKFMIVYHTPDLLKTVAEVNNEETYKRFISELIRLLNGVIDAEEGVVRKEREQQALKQIRFIITNSHHYKIPTNEMEFVYETVFSGLNRFLDEKSIEKSFVNLILDEEAKTYDAACKFGYSTVVSGKSDKMCEIRVSDWIASFIGRILFAIMADKGMQEDSILDIESLKEVDLASKRILSDEWFNISERQFNLYKLIYEVMIINQQSYWAANTLSYGDQCAMFYSLLRYFAGYESYSDFKKVVLSMHSEYFNSACLIELKRSYKEF